MKSITRQEILEVGERLLRERGYHGWSYRDISDAVGIQKASIHYHFPKKEDLGCVLIAQYRKRVEGLMKDLLQKGGGLPDQLLAFANLYGKSLLNQNSFCLCGMVAADLFSLPQSMQESVISFFQGQVEWVANLFMHHDHIMRGRRQDPILEAEMVVSSLQGMLLISRLDSNPSKKYASLVNVFLASWY